MGEAARRRGAETWSAPKERPKPDLKAVPEEYRHLVEDLTLEPLDAKKEFVPRSGEADATAILEALDDIEKSAEEPTQVTTIPRAQEAVEPSRRLRIADEPHEIEFFARDEAPPQPKVREPLRLRATPIREVDRRPNRPRREQPPTIVHDETDRQPRRETGKSRAQLHKETVDRAREVARSRPATEARSAQVRADKEKATQNLATARANAQRESETRRREGMETTSAMDQLLSTYTLDNGGFQRLAYDYQAATPEVRVRLRERYNELDRELKIQAIPSTTERMKNWFREKILGQNIVISSERKTLMQERDTCKQQLAAADREARA